VLVSGQAGLKKPDHRIYQLLFEKFDIIPHQALFIDDNLRNIKAAEEVGLNTIHFKNPIDLKEKLSALQII
jgi:2-haloacid dehalogenase